MKWMKEIFWERVCYLKNQNFILHLLLSSLIYTLATFYLDGVPGSFLFSFDFTATLFQPFPLFSIFYKYLVSKSVNWNCCFCRVKSEICQWNKYKLLSYVCLFVTVKYKHSFTLLELSMSRCRTHVGIWHWHDTNTYN
jgi:hypothetical protein